VVTGLDRNLGSGGQSRLAVEAVDGTGRGLETGGGGTGAEGETGLGTGIAVQMAGARRAEEAEANRKGRGRRLLTKQWMAHRASWSVINSLKSTLGPVNMKTCSHSKRLWQW